MAVAKAGDNVAIHYTGTLSDGTVFDSSEGRAPLEFRLGSGQVIPGFDTGVTGMEVGERKTINIPAAQAYGPYRDDQVLAVDRSMFPPDANPQVGEQFQVQQQGGGAVVVTVKSIQGDTILLDANHALAGKDLTFALELVSIN